MLSTLENYSKISFRENGGWLTPDNRINYSRKEEDLKARRDKYKADTPHKSGCDLKAKNTNIFLDTPKVAIKAIKWNTEAGIITWLCELCAYPNAGEKILFFGEALCESCKKIMTANKEHRNLTENI